MAEEPSEPNEEVVPYVLLTALSFLNEKSGLERAAALPAPNFQWYSPLSAELMRTFDPIQSFAFHAPAGISDPLLVVGSNAKTETKLILLE